MNNYTNKITLFKNDRGLWVLDPFKGCYYGLHSRYNGYKCGLSDMFKNSSVNFLNKKGCYGLCYASRFAKLRGYKFDKTTKRDFADDKHLKSIGKKLQQILFVRLGVNCDPSDDWDHTLSITEKIKPYIKNIVIVTKHWNELGENQLPRLKGICINTSVSALDDGMHVSKRLFWYHKLKDYCKSVLRVNTADFIDAELRQTQNELLQNENVIDNVLRFNKNHELVKSGIVNVKKYKFLSSFVYASKHDENIYFGYCEDCPDQCGINI